MVATRNHPSDFDEPQTSSPQPTSSPRKRTTRTSNANASPTKSSSPPATPTKTVARSARASTRNSGGGWAHAPSNLTLIWLAISLPLVVYDSTYVLFRPHSMPGGKLYSIWKPYGWYGEVDRYYGFKAYNAGMGWTAAQTWFNVLETLAYMVYLYIVYTYGEQEPIQGAGAPDKSVMGQFRALSESRTVYGKFGTWAVFLAYSAASLTFWKTVLYWLNEYLSGFDMIGHNTWFDLIVYWVGLNAPWIIVPGYLSYVFGKEIIEGLEVAAGSKSR